MVSSLDLYERDLKFELVCREACERVYQGQRSRCYVRNDYGVLGMYSILNLMEQAHSTTQSAASNRAHVANILNRQTTRRPRKHASTRRVTPTDHRFRASHRERAISAWMVDRLAKLGLSRNSGRQEPQQAVYSCFNRAGRLFYRLNTKNSRNIRGLVTDAGSAYRLPSKTWNVARGSKE
jgi:hypothetical protein